MLPRIKMESQAIFTKNAGTSMGDPLVDVMREVFEEQELPLSMRIFLMVFGSKLKKMKSILPRDKRKISLLNSDFKIFSFWS